MAMVILSTEELTNTVHQAGLYESTWDEYLCSSDIVALGIATYIGEFTGCGDNGDVEQIAIRLLNDHMCRDPNQKELQSVMSVWARVAELVEAKVPMGSFTHVRYAGTTTNGQIIHLINGRGEFP